MEGSGTAVLGEVGRRLRMLIVDEKVTPSVEASANLTGWQTGSKPPKALLGFEKSAIELPALAVFG